MAPTALPSPDALRGALLDLYTRSAHLLRRSMDSSDIESTMSASLTKRMNYVDAKEFSKGIIAIFAILGGGMALAVWWFFQKRGGFKWREDDWDDYKSSVLRRKGPDGKTISSGSTRAPDTVVTDLTYQTESTEVTEKTGRSGRSSKKSGGKLKKNKNSTPAAVWTTNLPPPPKRSDSKRSLRSTFSAGLGLGIFSRWGGRRDRSPTSTERDRDPDLESYADEEPARMRSYNPHPVHAPPSEYTESDIVSQAEEDRRYHQREHQQQQQQRSKSKKQKDNYNPAVGRFPSRYAYTYARTEEDMSDTSSQQAPPPRRGSNNKSQRRSDPQPQRASTKRGERAAQQPDLSTIADETETRLSFEADDDARFTHYSESISVPTPAHTKSKKLASTTSRPAKSYNMSSSRNHPKSKYSTSSRSGRKHSAGTYQTASTEDSSDSDSDCPSDCSCCTTDSDDYSDDGGESTVSRTQQKFKESAQGDLGTKVYHHPLASAAAVNPLRVSSPVPGEQIRVGKRGGNAAQNPERRIVGARSYRQESRGSLSSDSEGDSGNETVTSRVQKALGRR